MSKILKMKEEPFDMAIIGAGASGLLLLHQAINHTEWKEKRILIIDNGDRSQKSWCFWWSKNLPLNFLIEKSWHSIKFMSTNRQATTSSISPLCYHYISSEKLFDFFFNDFIPKHSNITLIKGQANNVKKNGDIFQIDVNSKEKFSTLWLADSRPEKLHVSNGEKAINQHFYGRFVQTQEDIFDASKATLMDFSRLTSQKNTAIFHYILPFDSRNALIETTAFSTDIYQKDLFVKEWNCFWEENYPKTSYKIIKEEIGSIPMVNTKFPLKSPLGFYKIGTASGQVKPTTGYAFTRMLEDANNLLSGLNREKTKRFLFYDKILLSIMLTDMRHIPKIMDNLFNGKSTSGILLFLDEKSRLFDDIKIFCRLQLGLFLKHAFKVIFKWI